MPPKRKTEADIQLPATPDPSVALARKVEALTAQLTNLQAELTAAQQRVLDAVAARAVSHPCGA